MSEKTPRKREKNKKKKKRFSKKESDEMPLRDKL